MFHMKQRGNLTQTQHRLRSNAFNVMQEWYEFQLAEQLDERPSGYISVEEQIRELQLEENPERPRQKARRRTFDGKVVRVSAALSQPTARATESARRGGSKIPPIHEPSPREEFLLWIGRQINQANPHYLAAAIAYCENGTFEEAASAMAIGRSSYDKLIEGAISIFLIADTWEQHGHLSPRSARR